MSITEALEKYELDQKVGVRVYDGKSLLALQVLAKAFVDSLRSGGYYTNERRDA